MISRLSGVLESVSGGRAELRCGDFVYSLFVPGFDEQRLAAHVGEPAAFHTLHYLESPNQGSMFVPRLIGFASPSDRAFFEVFTTVKGIGNRKALRALQIPCSRVAEAISRKDFDTLKALPEIGKRLAETIVAELHGKVDEFIAAEAARGRSAAPARQRTLGDDAVAVLVTLGEPKLAAMQWVDRALAADPEIASAEALVTAAFRLKSLPV